MLKQNVLRRLFNGDNEFIFIHARASFVTQDRPVFQWRSSYKPTVDAKKGVVVASRLRHYRRFKWVNDILVRAGLFTCVIFRVSLVA